MTKDLVALHHGTIYAFSNKEEGNTFVVQIPVRREAFKEEEIDESMEYAAYNVLPVGEVEEAVATDMAEREPGSSSVLLVEDNEDSFVVYGPFVAGQISYLTGKERGRGIGCA